MGSKVTKWGVICAVSTVSLLWLYDFPQRLNSAQAQQDARASIRLPGTIGGMDSAQIYSKIGGYVAKVSADIGDQVAKGQVLARLHVPEMSVLLRQKQAQIRQAQATIAQAQAALAQAKSDVQSAHAQVTQARASRREKQAVVSFRKVEYDRWDQLLKTSPSIERRKLDEARYQLEAAQADLESLQADIEVTQANVAAMQARVKKSEADVGHAQAQLEVAEAIRDHAVTMMNYIEIKAPFDGIMTRRMVDVGDFVQNAENNSAAQPLFQVDRIDRVRVIMHVPMSDIAKLNVGDRAVLEQVSARPERSFEGTITRVALSLQESSRTMRAEMHLDNSGEGVGRLLPGYYGYVRIHLDDAE